MHWGTLTGLKKKQKQAVKGAIELCRLTGETIPELPLLIMITRVGPRKLDDDNLQSSCKYIRDEIARIVGVDDGSDQYTWLYKDRIGDYGVEVEIVTR